MNFVMRIMKGQHVGKGLPLGSIFLVVPIEREQSPPSVRDVLHNIVVINAPYLTIDQAKDIFESPVLQPGGKLINERRFHIEASGLSASLLARLAGQRTVDVEWSLLRPLIFDRTTDAVATDAAIGL